MQTSHLFTQTPSSLKLSSFSLTLQLPVKHPSFQPNVPELPPNTSPSSQSIPTFSKHFSFPPKTPASPNIQGSPTNTSASSQTLQLLGRHPRLFLHNFSPPPPTNSSCLHTKCPQIPRYTSFPHKHSSKLPPPHPTMSFPCDTGGYSVDQH